MSTESFDIFDGYGRYDDIAFPHPTLDNPQTEEDRLKSGDFDPRFEHDMLMCMIALQEGRHGNIIDLNACSRVAVSLIKEEDLPLHLLGKKKVDNT
ncbi:MAG: hypothetical protein RLZZ517_318 [Candidatus Parcubacteria bacterium]|jgi:hypothetical protein